MKYREVSKGQYLIRLDKGDEVIGSITAFAHDEYVMAAFFSGIGGITNASIGNYNAAARQYIAKTYKNMLEVGYLNGNIALQEDSNEIMVHAHITAANDEDGIVVGHLFGAMVEITLEIYLRAFDFELYRKNDPETEYRIWHL